ncbi:hypothetical protein [Gillisia limnaea]|uniref:Uncharacterized protein n=2 Tax=Gillisia TaxID=244698 RepID=H2BX83_GILLR|nr:hypothetical protein Gilli_2447 [Gillisia limnaea DSM 15749]
MRILDQSRFFSSYQCDGSRCFYIDFNHKTVKMSFCQLLSFRQKLLNIDLDSHFNGENSQGIEILMLCNKEHLFIFNTLEILDLKKLLNNTFTALEINSMIAC